MLHGLGAAHRAAGAGGSGCDGEGGARERGKESRGLEHSGGWLGLYGCAVYGGLLPDTMS